MGNVVAVYVRDLKRLARVPSAWLVVLFLMVLPSLYTWFNVAAFWDPYEATGNLTVCVVNEDAGVEDSSIGALDLGGRICASLAGNDRLKWRFCDRDEAAGLLMRGTAYAVLVIPEEFSADVAALADGTLVHPTIGYYVNEKTGPVAPKITDTGASTLDTTVNDQFIAAVSGVVAQVADEAAGQIDEQVRQGRQGALEALSQAQEALSAARAKTASAVRAAREGAQAADDAKDTVQQAQARLSLVGDAMQDVARLSAQASGGLVEFSAGAGAALPQATAQLSRAAAQADLAAGEVAGAVKAAQATARAAEAALAGRDVEPGQAELDLDAALDAVTAAAGSVDAAVQDSLDAADSFTATLNDETIPALGSDLESLSAAVGATGAAVGGQQALADQTLLLLDQLSATLGDAAEALERTDGMLGGLEDDLSQLASDLGALSAAGALEQAFGGTLDPQKIAGFMESPTRVEAEQLYQINAYGSAMAPLFLNLTLWIGVFMLMVIIRLEVDDEDVPGLTVRQHHLGRLLLLAPLAVVQALVCCTGCLVLGVQTVSVGAFMLTAAVASLAYLCVQYTLSTTMQHVGKGICVILVFVQIPGATGLYPTEMTPQFFQDVYPLFPFTYGINALRETICGFYGAQWLDCLGVLLAFGLAFLVAGTLLRPSLTNLNRLFARQIEEGDLLNGELVTMPARRYRIGQLVRMMTDRDEYRDVIESRTSKFLALYPHVKTWALFAGVVVPLASILVLAIADVDKVGVLTLWLVWLLVVIVFLVVLEYVRDSIVRQHSLEDLSDAQMRELYRTRNVARAAGAGAAADGAEAGEGGEAR